MMEKKHIVVLTVGLICFTLLFVVITPKTSVNTRGHLPLCDFAKPGQPCDPAFEGGGAGGGGGAPFAFWMPMYDCGPVCQGVIGYVAGKMIDYGWDSIQNNNCGGPCGGGGGGGLEPTGPNYPGGGGGGGGW